MDTALKQRLIGAVVLVALAVIFLPMLIKGPAPDSGVSDVPLAVPASPDGQFETRELPLVTPGNAPNGGAVGLDNTAAAPKPVTPAAASEAIPLGAAPAEPQAMLPATVAAGNLAVNFGAYATATDADVVIARLKQSKLPAFREPTVINGKQAYRVRIGPYADRADAEAARLQATQVRGDVKAQVVTLDAQVPSAAPTSAPAPATASVTQATTTNGPVTTQTLPPESAKPAVAKPVPPSSAPAPVPATKPVATVSKPVTPTPATPKPAAGNVGFAVQLGAFSQAADANALRDRLRAAGFSAFVQQVKTDKGTLNRVRVGPVASRADADALKSQVAAKSGIQGMVSAHP
jgi:cell division septation protein DedD